MALLLLPPFLLFLLPGLGTVEDFVVRVALRTAAGLLSAVVLSRLPASSASAISSSAFGEASCCALLVLFSAAVICTQITVSMVKKQGAATTVPGSQMGCTKTVCDW